MSNSYYTVSTDVTPFTTSQDTDIDIPLAQIEAGFDKLPEPHASKPGFKTVAISDATATDEAVTAGQIITGALKYKADTGAANAYVVELSVAPASYYAGMEICFKAANANTGASTVNVNALGVKSLKRFDGTDLVANDISAGQVVCASWTGTYFQVTSALPSYEVNAVTAAAAAAASAAVAGLLTDDSLAVFPLDESVAATNTAAVQSAEATSQGSYFVPGGDYPTTLGISNINKRYHGFGQIGLTTGKLAPYYATTSARPTLGNHGSILTAFNGDLNGVVFPIGHRITGADTLGTPTSGYTQTPETTAIYINSFNSSGYNHSATANDGRTGMIVQHIKIAQAGRGDATCYQGNVVVTGQEPGATFCLARPAGQIIGGSCIAGADLTNLMIGEMSVEDYGFDCRGTGLNLRFTRDNNTKSDGAWWNGIRMVSNGTYEVESAIQIYQKWGIGLDFAGGTISKAAIALKSGQKIEFHATATVEEGVSKYADTLNGWSIYHDSGVSGVRCYAGTGVEAFRYTATQTIVPGTGRSLVVSADGGLTVNGGPSTFSGGAVTITGGNLNLTGRVVSIDGSQVLGPRKTGWFAATGAASRATFDTATVTTEQLAYRVKTIIDDLISHGILGA